MAMRLLSFGDRVVLLESIGGVPKGSKARVTLIEIAGKRKVHYRLALPSKIRKGATQVIFATRSQIDKA